MRAQTRSKYAGIARCALRILGAFTLSVVALWFAGRVVSDRFAWSQWLLWIPTPVVLVLMSPLVVWAIVRIRRERIRAALCLLTFITVCVYFALIEHRLLRHAPPSDPSLHLVHWNTANGDSSVRPDAFAEALLSMEPDIAIITIAGTVQHARAIRDWLGKGRRPINVGAFTVFTHLPIIEVTSVVSANRVSIALLHIDTSTSIGRSLRILMVDLPSIPRSFSEAKYDSRASMVDDVLSRIESSHMPEYDIVVGDLNLTRGGASLSRLFPNARHAFDEAGAGYAATFPRGLPLYHVDHVLLNEGVRATQYEIVNHGIGSHCAQKFAIEFVRE